MLLPRFCVLNLLRLLNAGRGVYHAGIQPLTVALDGAGAEAAMPTIRFGGMRPLFPR